MGSNRNVIEHIVFEWPLQVSEKTEMSVTVKFPSMTSVCRFFQGGTSEESKDQEYPALDDSFVMGVKLAGKVLHRQIPSEEFHEQRRSKGFWLVSPHATGGDTFSSPPSLSAFGDGSSKSGSCLSELKCTGMTQWGVRRQVNFIDRHGANTLRDSSEHVKEEKNANEEGEEDDTLTGEPHEGSKKSRKRKRDGSSRLQHVRTMGTDQKQKQICVYSKNKQKVLKSSKDRWSAERYKLAEKNMLEILRAKGAIYGNPILRPALRAEARKKIGDTGLLDHLLKHMAGKVAPGGSERFQRRHNADGAMEYWLESADLVLIRKEAGVEDPYWTPPPGWKPGDNPTQDPVCARELKLLREEIAQMKRDMQGLVSKKQEDSQLAIVTQNSSATDQNSETNSSLIVPLKDKYEELVKRKAKIEEQLLEISNSLSALELEMGMLTPKKVVEESSSCRLQSSAIILCRSTGGGADKQRDLGDHHQADGSRNYRVETSVVAENDKKGGDGDGSDGDKKGKEEVENEEKGIIIWTNSTKSNDHKHNESKNGEEEDDKEAKRQRLRSGFRICRPYGTFLWPSTSTATAAASATNSTTTCSPSDNKSQQQVVVVPVEDHLMVPSPPTSASSSGAPPRLFSPPPLPPQYHNRPPKPMDRLCPVRPLAERRAVKVTISTVAPAAYYLSQLADIGHDHDHGTPGSATSASTRLSNAAMGKKSSLINLNEVPTTMTTATSPTGLLRGSQSHTHHATVPTAPAPPRLLPCTETQGMKAWEVHSRGYAAASCVAGGGDTWLALATPSSTSVDNSNRG
ncbi:protein DYAD [Malania oleifera]|uniref:protein DYAD n=1 Tax=Malania oleifera TaxID=397392 RepID=UPI0025ADA2B2|nr:protein DYAD [Malania oleifera]